jgi:hypothetical protein
LESFYGAQPHWQDTTHFENFEPKPRIHDGDGDMDCDNLDEAPSLMLPSQDTPLYNAFLNKLVIENKEKILESFADLSVFSKLKTKPPYLSAEQPADKRDDPYDLGLRTEHLLAVTEAQRSIHIARLHSRNDVRAQTPHTLVFTADDMREIMNTWRNSPETWSNSWAAIKDLKTHQTKHQSLKTKFNTMLFQMIGNKALVELFVRFPLLSAEQPGTVLSNITRVLQLEDPEKYRAQIISQPNLLGVVRPSKQIHALQQLLKDGRWIDEWIVEDRNNWYKLTHAQQLLWRQYNDHDDIAREINELRKKQKPKFSGTAERAARELIRSPTGPD